MLLVMLCLLSITPVAQALDANAVRQLAAEETDSKLEAINKLVTAGDAAVIPIFKAMQDDRLQVYQGRVVVSSDTVVRDAMTGQTLDITGNAPEGVLINNRIRSALDSAIASLKLLAPDRTERLAAAQAVAMDANAEMLPLIQRALARETDAEVKAVLAQANAAIELKNPDVSIRRQAVQQLALSENPQTKQFLNALLEKDADGTFLEPDAEVRAEARKAIQLIDSRFVIPQTLGTLFYGLSLGSVLLLAALGLAITFGLMGIINMAHGEMLMIGAYTTYGVQTFFRHYAPGAFDAYLIAAVPAAFVVCALVGIVLERSVIRHLYGRPLETLLTTWGISLILIQLVRMLFGAQNVEVENPAWMSGGFALGGDVVLAYNRMVIVLFAGFVVLLVWLLLNRTRLGLYLRAVTQNRSMADCMGIPTPRVDALTFGLGSGIAGLGGVALSQIGNVGPDLGQSYIVDSFMVVVLGGVGQLAGTVIAAMGLGEINKFLEPYAGAVLAKIIVLVFIILFIQKRPQGLFALKGRTAEA